LFCASRTQEFPLNYSTILNRPKAGNGLFLSRKTKEVREHQVIFSNHIKFPTTLRFSTFTLPVFHISFYNNDCITASSRILRLTRVTTSALFFALLPSTNLHNCTHISYIDTRPLCMFDGTQNQIVLQVPL